MADNERSYEKLISAIAIAAVGLAVMATVKIFIFTDQGARNSGHLLAGAVVAAGLFGLLVLIVHLLALSAMNIWIRLPLAGLLIIIKFVLLFGGLYILIVHHELQLLYILMGFSLVPLALVFGCIWFGITQDKEK